MCKIMKKSNKPTNTKKAMKKTMKFFSMAALAMVGAVMTSCSSDDFTDNTQQNTENNGNSIETLNVTISMAGDETRALDAEGHKTFSVGDKIAVVYKNTSGTTVKAESEALTSTDIIAANRANFTVTLINADKTKNVTYIYPAVMVDEDANVNNDALTSQDGTLENIESNLDYCEYTGAWDSESLPMGTLDNKLAICAFTLKTDGSGSTDITNTITNLTVSDGTYTYNVNREAAAGPIYVAIHPTSSKNINYTATSGSKYYVKSVTSKTYAAGNWYPLGLKMAEVISGKFTVSNGKQVYFSKGNLRATNTTANSTSGWTWSFATNQWDYIGTTSANSKISADGKISESGTVDLFSWSTAARHYGISKNTTNTDYVAGSFVDWGSASEVTAGIGTGWRTLTQREWEILLGTNGDSDGRTTISGIRYAKAKVNDICGVIILPDNWDTNYYSLNSTNSKEVAYTSNVITLENWTNKLEAHGAVFLPAAGQRNSGTTINNVDENCDYWSITPVSESNVSSFRAHITSSGVSVGGAGRCNGYSVRLVRDVR